MKPFVKKILLSVGISAVIFGSFLGIKSFVYSQASEDIGFYDKVKKEMDKNANNDNFTLFQAMQAVTAQENLDKKSKITDPNDPRNDPRLKHYFGATEEIAPVPAVVKYGGVTLKVQANELIMSDLNTSEVTGDLDNNLRFLLTYPSMTGKTPENFDDFYNTSLNEKRNIWLDIFAESECGAAYSFSDDIDVIKNDLSKLTKQQKQDLIKSRYCDNKRSRDITYSSYGDTSFHVPGTYESKGEKLWRKPNEYPDLSQYYTMDKLTLEGYKISGFTEKGTGIIDERVYKYIPRNAKADEYEFIVCGSNQNTIPKKFSNISFRNYAHSSCQHYLLFKNRFLLKIRYSEKYFKHHWQGIRNAVVKNFDSRIIAVDDYVPQYFTKENNIFKPIPVSFIDNLIAEQQQSLSKKP